MVIFIERISVSKYNLCHSIINRVIIIGFVHIMSQAVDHNPSDKLGHHQGSFISYFIISTPIGSSVITGSIQSSAAIINIFQGTGRVVIGKCLHIMIHDFNPQRVIGYYGFNYIKYGNHQYIPVFRHRQ